VRTSLNKKFKLSSAKTTIVSLLNSSNFSVGSVQFNNCVKLNFEPS